MSLFKRMLPYLTDSCLRRCISNIPESDIGHKIMLMKGMKVQGVPANEAEAITEAIIKVVNDEEVSNREEHHLNIFQLEILMLRTEIEKSTRETSLVKERSSSKLQLQIDQLSSEVNKSIHKQDKELHTMKLGLNEEITKEFADVTKLINQNYSENHGFLTKLETIKFDLAKKFCMTMITSGFVIFGVALAWM